MPRAVPGFPLAEVAVSSRTTVPTIPSTARKPRRCTKSSKHADPSCPRAWSTKGRHVDTGRQEGVNSSTEEATRIGSMTQSPHHEEQQALSLHNRHDYRGASQRHVPVFKLTEVCKLSIASKLSLAVHWITTAPDCLNPLKQRGSFVDDCFRPRAFTARHSKPERRCTGTVESW